MKYVYLIDKDEEIEQKITNIFKKDEGLKIVKHKPDEIESVLRNVPDILVINEDRVEEDIIKYCKKIRSNNDNSITPIIIISSNNKTEHIIDILKNDVELVLSQPINEEILYYSIKNIIRLLNSNRTVSPLTGLPGNIQIQAEMKKRLQNGNDFAMLYLDLDNFKAYNDTYGFANGDEIIKFTAKTICNNILKENCEKNFVGHIGGDDFMAIVEGNNYEEICQGIIAEFDAGLPRFFNKDDLERGYLEVENRKGIIEQFPLTSISIGVVEVTKERFRNTLEIGEAGAAVKHLAKTIYGSTYVIDRRKNRDEHLDKAIKVLENKG